jgi:hypothetical protein
MKSGLLKLTRNIAPVALLFAFSACGDSATQSGPGGLTPDDARALDDAAAKLDAKALPPPAPLQTIMKQPATGSTSQPGAQQAEAKQPGAQQVSGAKPEKK